MEPNNFTSDEIGKESFTVRDNVALEEQEKLQAAEDELIRLEKHRIRCLRRLMVMVLMLCSVIIIVLGNALTKRSTLNKMVILFEDSASHLVKGFERQMNNTVYVSWYLSAVMTNRYSGLNIWPNVTLPDFDLQVVGLSNIVNSTSISFTPLIDNNTNRLSWEQYAAENAHLFGSKSLVNRADNRSWIVSDGIFRFENGGQVYDPGYNPTSHYPHLLNPVWQVFPLEGNEKIIMMNGNTEHNPYRTRALDDMIKYKIPSLTAPVHLSQDIGDSPSTILMFPIFDSQIEEELDHISETSANVVGISAAAYSWDTIFNNILPSDIQGIICVLKASTGDTYTFEVNGPNVIYKGQGDLHDPKYDEFGISKHASIALLNDQLAIADNLVTYSLYIYPSDDFQHMFETSFIVTVTLASILMFLFVTGLFFLYDHLLYLNIKRLHEESYAGNKIVNSLYPEGVRDRLISMNTRNKNKKKTRKAPITTLTTFLTLGTIQSDDNQKSISIESEPICDQFPAVTIMFADIPGFKCWSSNHTPQEIFKVLESVFQAFDRAAKKLGVFKVETIEDCYVAVCGLPESKHDHAVIMAQFALECQRKFNQVINSLDAIGADILRLRSGLHSGAITAGILRGEKCRFQLFGDTMNTASRMESTGQPTKIQISEQTAELLTQANKSSWFIPRDELITAKGKGTLQTYWLIPNVHMKKSARRISSIPRRFSTLTKQLQSTRRISTKNNFSMRNITEEVAMATQTANQFNSKALQQLEQKQEGNEMKPNDTRIREIIRSSISPSLVSSIIENQSSDDESDLEENRP